VKNGGHLISTQMTRLKVCFILINDPYISHYRELPCATGPLASLESITELPDWQVAKMGQSFIF